MREKSTVESLLRASVDRLLDITLRLQPVRDALRAQTLDVALRHLDRLWRCRPEDAATLAPLYGRLLLLDAGDHDAAVHLLRRALELASDPEDAALAAWALSAAGRDDEARAQLESALAAYVVKPDGLLYRVACDLTDRWHDSPGWIGRAPDLGFLGELLCDEPASIVDIELHDPASPVRLLYASAGDDRSFTAQCPPTLAGARLLAGVDGSSLLGSGAALPPLFSLDGRAAPRERRLEGWARIGWAPDRTLPIAVEDEHGRRVAATIGEARIGGGHAFALDLGAVGSFGSRLKVMAQLPDGRWQPLPDSPLLLDAGLPEPRGKPLRLMPWGTEPVRPRGRTVPLQRAAGVDVIIPVYRDREATLACIAAVLATVESTTPVVVVDDATEDAELAAALDALAAAARITLLRNDRNRGFAASVNRALSLHASHDAVLLNADTLVFDDWLSRLREAAYSGASVGTVTPWSNNASIASYPQARGCAIAPADAAALHALARATHARVRVPLPVGVGFCLYVRRDCLDDVGPLDAAVFDQGYGEETDFCVRGRRRGWSHRLAADVFVYHAGAGSFGARRQGLLDRSQRLLNLRHPGYDRLVAQFLQADPLRHVRRRLDEGRLQAFDGRFVLVVTLALKGGVDRFVTQRRRELQAAGLFALLLKPAAADDAGRCELSTDALDVPNLRYEIPADLQQLGTLLRSLPIVAIEIQHFMHLHPDVIDAVRALPVPYQVVIHDYSWVCPRVTLIDGSSRYCGEPAVAVCETCVSRHGSRLGEALSVADLRSRSERWLRGAQRIVVPSLDTATRVQRHFPELTVDVMPHTPPAAAARLLPAARTQSATRPVRVALIGAIGDHKGFQVLLACAEHARDERLPLEFVVIGYTENDARLLATGKVFVTGRYADAEVPHLLRREQPDVIWFPSVWPETWCYALDHALDSGLPVAAFDLGAIAERLRSAGSGGLMPLNSDAAHIDAQLLRLASSTQLCSATASRSGQLSLARRSGDATMGLTESDEKFMTNAADANMSDQGSEPGLSASVQVLQLDAGLYLFSVTTATTPADAGAGQLRLPAMHVGLGPGVEADRVEFMSGPVTQGAWLFATTDQVVVKVRGAGAALVLTSVRAPAGDVLSIKVEQLSARAQPSNARVEPALPLAAAVAPPAPLDPLNPALPVHISAHIRTRGDMAFPATAWAGRVAPGLWIESFSVRPLERLTAQDLEYKGLTGSGFETPWTTDDQPCGTQGMSVPLVGFALRFKPSAATAGCDCEYSGYFQSGLVVGPLRNGAPCRSTVANDPLEGIQVRLVKRTPPVSATAVPRRAGRAAPRHTHRVP